MSQTVQARILAYAQEIGWRFVRAPTRRSDADFPLTPTLSRRVEGEY